MANVLQTNKVDAQCDKVAFDASVPFEFCRDFWHQKTKVLGLSCGVVCVILRLAVSVEHRLVTDAQTETLRQLMQVKYF